MDDRSIEIFIRSWQLVMGGGGAFEVTVNGDLVFSKKQSGRYPEPGEIKAAIRKKLEESLPPGVSIP